MIQHATILLQIQIEYVLPLNLNETSYEFPHELNLSTSSIPNPPKLFSSMECKIGKDVQS